MYIEAYRVSARKSVSDIIIMIKRLQSERDVDGDRDREAGIHTYITTLGQEWRSLLPTLESTFEILIQHTRLHYSCMTSTSSASAEWKQIQILLDEYANGHWTAI